MRLSDRSFATSVAFFVLCASARSADAQSDRARSAQAYRPAFVGACVDGSIVRILDDSKHYESFSIQPGDIYV